MAKAKTKAPAIQNARYDTVPVGDLTEHPANVNLGDVGAISGSIERFGFVGTIIAQESTGLVLAGNHRLRAARQAGMAEVPVAFVDITDEEAIAFMLADNRTAALAHTDNVRLAELLQSLNEGAGLDGTGYTGDDLDELLADLADPSPASDASGVRDPDAPPADEAQTKWGVKLGDVWQLGDQLLACGDSLAGGIEVVMGGDLAHAVWTDPPYGVSYQANESVESLKARNRRTDGLVVENDVQSPDDLDAFLRAAFTAALAATRAGGAWYVAAPAGPPLAPFLAALGPVLRQCLVWVKGSMVFGRSDYHYQHEMILYGWKPGKAHTWVGDRTQTSVLNFDRPHASPEHPTMKPVELIAYCLQNSTRKGHVVLDPFSGSGSTLLACHELGRKGRGVELSPRYVAVTLERFVRLGIEPERVVEG